MYDLGGHLRRCAGAYKVAIGYKLVMSLPIDEHGVVNEARTLFEGDDFGCSPLHSTDSNEAVQDLMAFLTLSPSDTDDEYFESYTPDQTAYCQQYAETLSVEVLNWFEEKEGEEKCED